MEITYFEDVPLNEKETVGQYTVTKEELIGFASKWDPLPMHIDEHAAESNKHGGLIAPACYTVSVAMSLLAQLKHRPASIGGAGWDVQFPIPVRPGDRLSITSECVEKRESRSKSDRGVAHFVSTMHNQNGDVVLRHKAVVIVEKHHDGAR